MDIAKRFIEYRRAIWVGPASGTLEQSVRAAWTALPTSTARVVKRKDGSSVMAVALENHGVNGVSVHCARYTEDQGVGIVPMGEQQVAALSEREPGDDESFLTSDFFFLVAGNNVITLNAARGAASARSYLHEMFRLAGLDESHAMFDLARVADANELVRIGAAGGVERLQLDLAIEDATAQFVADQESSSSVTGKMLGSLASGLQSVFGANRRSGNLALSSKGTMRLSIKVPNGDFVAAKDGLTSIAEDVVADEHADDYVILLRNGETIKPGEIAVKKLVSLRRSANSFRSDDVLHEMTTYLGELQRSGQTEA